MSTGGAAGGRGGRPTAHCDAASPGDSWTMLGPCTEAGRRAAEQGVAVA